MITIKLIILAILFVITSGTLFSTYFRKNKILYSLSILVSLVGSVYLMEKIYNDITENVYDKLKKQNTVKVNIVDIKNNISSIKTNNKIIKIEKAIYKTSLSYKDGFVNTSNIEIKNINDSCLKDANFMLATKGLSVLFSYYYLFRLDYLKKDYSYFSYPDKDDLSFKEIISHMSASDLINNFGKYLSSINKEDYEAIYYMLYEINLSYDKFISFKNEKEISLLNPKSDIVRLSKHENKCFNNSMDIHNIKVGKKITFYSAFSLNVYFSNFWSRRYDEGNIEEVKNIINALLLILR